jgi:NADH-quinone oxidoreductase subunit F
MILNEVCYRTLNGAEPWDLDYYLSLGGYESWKKIIAESTPPQDIIEIIKASGLRGRGGAGFSTGMKWSFMPKENTGPVYAICNADESEPGAFKDRDILRFNPHQLIEGIAIGAYAIGAQTAYCYIRGEFSQEGYIRFQSAIEEAYAQGFLGSSLYGSDRQMEIHAVLGAGAYICGEETALMESLEGKKGLPRFKPPFPAQHGLFGKPTNINNAETYASIPVILSKGAQWFADLGPIKNGGTKIFSISGHVEKPGNYEVPLGTPFKDLLELAGGVWKGHTLKAVIPGGSSTPILPADTIMTLNMDYDSLAKAGTFLGSGSVIVLDHTTDLPALLERIALFYYRESCGQCTPCREGTGWLWRILKRLNTGEGCSEDLITLKRIAGQMGGKTICALADGAAMPIKSFLEHFIKEFEDKIKRVSL